MNESNKHPTIAAENHPALPKEAMLWIRRMSLLLLLSSSTAMGAEKPETAEHWDGQTFACYASDKKEAEKVAEETFKAKFGITKKQAGVELAIEFSEATGKAKITIVKTKSPARAETPNKAEPWTGKTFSCYASDKKEAEKVAEETFKAKFGTTKEKAGVGLAIEFSEATGKATVRVMQNGLPLTTSDIPSSEIPELSVRLFTAITGNNIREAIAALQKGANPNSPVLGTSPLLAAIGRNDTEMVQLLIEKGATVNVSMPADLAMPGFSPLMLACANGQSPIARLLTDKGADVNASDSDGTTPLVAAISSGDLELVRFLIEKGANPNVRDKKGATPMDYAIQLKNQPLVELLAKHGAHYPRATR